MRAAVETAIAEGRMGPRLWLYPTYHCNLACTYCLTESHPRIADRRTLPREALLAAAAEARELGLTSLGISGGEVFMLPGFAETLVELSEILPTVTLTNGTLFTDRLLARLEPLARLPAAIQLSLDAAEPTRNDAFRGPRNFARVVDAIPRLVERGIRVRIATTVESQSAAELEALCTLHRELGIRDEDHVVRPVVRRGRAALVGMGVELGRDDVLPELTLTSEGTFLHPAAPTVRTGVTDLDLLVSRRTAPLARVAAAFLTTVGEQPAGADVVRNVR